MDITWLGNNSFFISDELVSIVVNPDDSILGSSLINENSVVISTESKSSYSTNLPVEYEVNNLSIFGVANGILKSGEKLVSTCFKLESRGLSVAVVGNIGGPFDSEALSGLSSSHAVVFSPDNNNIDAEILVNAIRSLETKKIIISGFDKNSAKSSPGLDSVNKVLGVKDFESKNKASFTLNNLGDSQEIIILEN